MSSVLDSVLGARSFRVDSICDAVYFDICLEQCQLLVFQATMTFFHMSNLYFNLPLSMELLKSCS